MIKARCSAEGIIRSLIRHGPQNVGDITTRQKNPEIENGRGSGCKAVEWHITRAYACKRTVLMAMEWTHTSVSPMVILRLVVLGYICA